MANKANILSGYSGGTYGHVKGGNYCTIRHVPGDGVQTMVWDRKPFVDVGEVCCKTSRAKAVLAAWS